MSWRAPLLLLLLLGGCGGFHPVDGADAGADAAAPDGGPEVLASGLAAPQQLAVGGGFVYWVEQGTFAKNGGDGRVARVPVGGCPAQQPRDCPLVIASDVSNPSSVALSFDGGALYWTEFTDATFSAASGRVWRTELPAGTNNAVAVAAMQDGPRGLAVDDRSFYWLDAGAGQVRREDYVMGTPDGATIVPGQRSPMELAFSSFGNVIYWTNFGDDQFTGSVWTASPDGAEAQAIATNQQQPRGIAAGSTYVFWANAGNGTIMRIGTDGTGESAFASSLATPSDVALDGGWLYWVEGGTSPNYVDGRVVAKRLDGSETRVLAGGRIYPHAVALDVDWVYWVDRGTPGGDFFDGAVARVAKPK